MKEIEIQGKKYNIDCNVLSTLHYKKLFNAKMLKDVNTMQSYLIRTQLVKEKLKEKYPDKDENFINELTGESMLEKADEFLEVLLQITYTMIYTVNQNVESYETFLAGISKVDLSEAWVSEVTELTVACFCRQ